VRLSPFSATVAKNGETTATVAEFGDSRTFLRQCGQALSRYTSIRVTTTTSTTARAGLKRYPVSGRSVAEKIERHQ